jgi:hypothetical protein
MRRIAVCTCTTLDGVMRAPEVLHENRTGGFALVGRTAPPFDLCPDVSSPSLHSLALDSCWPSRTLGV